MVVVFATQHGRVATARCPKSSERPRSSTHQSRWVISSVCCLGGAAGGWDEGGRRARGAAA